MNPNRMNQRCVTPCRDNRPSGVVGGIVVQNRTDACDKENAIQGLPVAMAYVPWQEYGNLYPVSQAFRAGTLFAELNLDFMGRRCN